GAGSRAVGDAGEGEDDGDGVRVETFRSRRVPDANTHGSGCTLSAAVAAELAKGAPVAEAVARATDHVERAIRRGRSVGRGTGPVDHLAPTKARAGTVTACEAVREVVRTFEREDVSRLVPEVGTNVAVAPAYAVDPADVAAVAGRLHRVPGGVRATGGVYPGASSHVARFLLGVREASDRAGATDVSDESVAAACNVRADEETVAAVEERLDTATVDRADEPEDAPGTMDWVASEAMAGRASAPGAVVDRGAVGKEPMIRLLAADAEALAVTVLELDAALA
ncbi:thiamine-phosphate synthase family protein, partial [Halorussus sp. GCM10023401]